MGLTLVTIIFIVFAALICELIDSSMGMLYGTILAPFLIVAGFSPLTAIPSILFSQAVGGITASFFHHRLQNVDFRPKSTNGRFIFKKIKEIGVLESFRKGFSRDLKVSIAITSLGMASAVLAAVLAVRTPKVVLETYIGILVLAMGILLVSKISFRFSWKKLSAVGIIASFNKGLAGGGFGPVTTAGQIISGNAPRNSIGSTTLAEAPICLAGFFSYLAKGFSDWNLLFCLLFGSIIGAAIGPRFTAKLKSGEEFKKILGGLVILLGIWTLAKTWLI